MFYFGIDRILYATSVSDFLPDLMCSVQINRLGPYSLWSRATSKARSLSRVGAISSGGHTAAVPGGICG